MNKEIHEPQLHMYYFAPFNGYSYLDIEVNGKKFAEQVKVDGEHAGRTTHKIEGANIFSKGNNEISITTRQSGNLLFFGHIEVLETQETYVGSFSNQEANLHELSLSTHKNLIQKLNPTKKFRISFVNENDDWNQKDWCLAVVNDKRDDFSFWVAAVQNSDANNKWKFKHVEADIFKIELDCEDSDVFCICSHRHYPKDKRDSAGT